MKNSVRWLMGIVLVGLMFANTGCVSYYAMEQGKKHSALRKATLKGDQAAIKAIDLGADAAGVGIDVSNWEALTEDPVKQILAALADAALIYAGKKGIDALNDGDTTPTSGGSQNNPSTTVNVNNADHTTVTVDNSTSTTTSTTETQTSTDSHSGNGNNR